MQFTEWRESVKTIGISFLLSLAFFFSPAFAGDNIFTNADLERYRDSENIMGSTAGSQSSASPQTDDWTAERWKQHYCYFGKKYQDIIDETEEDAKTCWEDYKKYHGNKMAFESRRCKHARLENQRAHQSYNDLANDAMRKGYPVGWLRCQYE